MIAAAYRASKALRRGRIHGNPKRKRGGVGLALNAVGAAVEIRYKPVHFLAAAFAAHLLPNTRMS